MYARAIAVLLHVQLRFGVLALAGVVLAVMLGSAVFSTFSLIVACLVKSRERFMGIGQVLTMPLFFASNAIYPLSLMPGWLRAVSRVNPLTYQVDALCRLSRWSFWLQWRRSCIRALSLDFVDQVVFER